MASFSTGVSIQYPCIGSEASFSSNHRYHQVKYPFVFPMDFQPSLEHQYESQTETYQVFQELAYHFTCEKMRRIVHDVLHNNNNAVYNQVLIFLKRYCLKIDTKVPVAAMLSIPTSPSGLRVRDYNAPVLFPAFHAFPTAAVITGTDVMSSELWVGPLMQTLRRTFPLCVLVPRDVATARRLIEWLAAKLAKLCMAKQKEEQWLEELVENFDLLPLDKPPVAFDNTNQLLARHDRAKVARVANSMMNAKDEHDEKKDESSDDSCYDSSPAFEDRTDNTECSSSRREKRKTRLTPFVYRRWTMSKLMSTIQRDIDELVLPNCNNACRTWVDMLGVLVHDRIQEALTCVKRLHEKEDKVVFWSIACFDDAVAWLQRKIMKAQDTAATLQNVAPDSNNRATFHVGITEMALALILYRVFHQYVSFLDECAIDQSVVNDRRRIVRQEMHRHEDYYLLTSEGGSTITMPKQTFCTSQPYLLLCIEQLEVFSPQVFRDFMDIWIGFIRQQHDNQRASELSGTLGFVIGVVSATSPALRGLDLTVGNRLELQFFSLIDSRKCFDDVLESLVVKTKLPLSFSGNLIRGLASRHFRVLSVPRLLLALRFLIYTHFKRCPWSFLVLALDDVPSLKESPVLVAANFASLPHRVSAWINCHRRELNADAQRMFAESCSALALWLASCSAFELQDLKLRVLPSSSSAIDADDNWITMLEAAMLTKRRRQDRWRMGWKCFRVACSWLDVRIGASNRAKYDEQEDLAGTYLALALEGRLGEASCYKEVMQQLQKCKWAVLSRMIEDWQKLLRVFGMSKNEEKDVEKILCELAMLCAYARIKKTPATIEIALRNELVAVFTDHLVSALLRPFVPHTMSSVDALVTKWSQLTNVNVLEERLRFDYYDNLRKVLQEAGIGNDTDDAGNNTLVQASWVHDVGLAFLFYQECAGASVSLCEWYDSFASELKNDMRSAISSKSRPEINDTAIKCRFVRAICTLRHWGFIKSDAPRDQEQHSIEKLVFI